LDNRPETGGGAGEFLARLGPGWPLADPQRRRLAPAVAAALAGGWDPAALAAFVGANTTGVRSPAAVLAARLSPRELPAPPGRARARPAWCGACDERTRMLGYHGGTPSRCPRCHPLADGGTEEAGRTPQTGGGRLRQAAVPETSARESLARPMGTRDKAPVAARSRNGRLGTAEDASQRELEIAPAQTG
jgi:hypothetical protein